MEQLPSYQEIKHLLPLKQASSAFIEQSRQTIYSILNGLDPRLLLIIGPCSIHDPKAAKEFACQLKQLANEVSPYFFLVMRVYCEKPRTSTGWKGLLYDPFLDGSHAMRTGLMWTRQLLLELAEIGVPAATEFLDPLTAFYYEDLITWGSIGARTASSQTHRQLASGLEMPIGIKNGVAGNISAAVNGVKVAMSPHTYIGLNEGGQLSTICTKGNPHTHIVLRGGEEASNYDPISVAEALQKLEMAQLPKRLLIDCSHHNSRKQHERQPHVFQSVLHQVAEGNTAIQGLLMESHLEGGSQPLIADLNQLKYGVSITDSCLDWGTTERLVKWGAEYMSRSSCVSSLSCSII